VAIGYPPPPDYVARYAPGSVPFLEDDGDGVGAGVAMGESVAMMLYLAQRYGPTPLLPAEPPAQARVLQLTIASEAALGGLMNPLMGTKFAAPADQKENWTAGFCDARAAGALAYVDSFAGETGYLVGEGLTLADIAIVTALGMWQGALDRPVPAGLAAHRERMMARPAYQRAKAACAAA
jgi:glutathione S-transferase